MQKRQRLDFASPLETTNQGQVQIFGKMGVKTATPAGPGSGPIRLFRECRGIAALR
jgi:hypothetical protein